ncbi:MAG: response regulator, partial [Deltaproteobacteria bacterium]|nr:response regulator [Deltaproteobacteria bacterium]
YRDFMESIEDSCAEFDLGGRCTFCNEAAHRMLGYSRKEYLQLHYRRRFVGPEDVRQVFTIFTELYRTGDPAKIYTVNVWCKDGSTKAIESIVTLIRDARGGVVGFRNIGRDVTARKRMEEEQERLRQQLSQARKMEAIGTLAGGVAHDFNNLLMGIQGYTSLMLLDTDPGHPHYAQLKAVESHVRSGADLTRQLLGYARGGRYEVKPVNLNEIVEKSAVMFGRTRKEITLLRDLAEDVWIVDADRGQMEQVLLNLLVNAWHAMPGGGDIFIRTRNVVLERAHVQSLDIAAGPYVKLTVRDTGVGMDEMTRERLFEPFFTTKEMGVVRGTGLGLASVYGIVKGHQGAIHVQSERGKGATFDIYFPASFKEVICESQPERITKWGRETILLAEDEANIAEVIGAMIKELGYHLLTAASGEEAVNIYLANSGRIDLVIMDMIMPGLSGGAAIDAIRAENPEARIILASGYSLDGEAQEILSRRGNISFMQKPFELADLSQKIREALDF